MIRHNEIERVNKYDELSCAASSENDGWCAMHRLYYPRPIPSLFRSVLCVSSEEKRVELVSDESRSLFLDTWSPETE